MKAFTLLETLLILAILSVFATLGYVWIPDSKLHLAQHQIQTHLHYTRFLSLTSAKQITQSAFCQSDHCLQERMRWSESLWRMQFSSLQNIGYAYYIFSDSARLAVTKNFDDRPRDRQEIARDLLNNKYLNVYNRDNSKFANALRQGDLAITQRYGIQKVKHSGGCAGSGEARILFDEKGFLRCKKPYEQLTNPDGIAFLELFNRGHRSVKICILQSGFIKEC